MENSVGDACSSVRGGAGPYGGTYGNNSEVKKTVRPRTSSEEHSDRTIELYKEATFLHHQMEEARQRSIVASEELCRAEKQYSECRAQLVQMLEGSPHLHSTRGPMVPPAGRLP